MLKKSIEKCDSDHWPVLKNLGERFLQFCNCFTCGIYSCAHLKKLFNERSYQSNHMDSQTINCDTRRTSRRRRSKTVTETGVSLKQLGCKLLIITKPNLLLLHSSYWKPLTDSEKWRKCQITTFLTLGSFDLLICEHATPQISTKPHLESGKLDEVPGFFP